MIINITTTDFQELTTVIVILNLKNIFHTLNQQSALFVYCLLALF